MCFLRHTSQSKVINSPHLDLDGPREVTDVDIKGDIGVASEGEPLTGETVSVLLDVSFGHDG